MRARASGRLSANSVRTFQNARLRVDSEGGRSAGLARLFPTRPVRVHGNRRRRCTSALLLVDNTKHAKGATRYWHRRLSRRLSTRGRENLRGRRSTGESPRRRVEITHGHISDGGSLPFGGSGLVERRSDPRPKPAGPPQSRSGRGCARRGSCRVRAHGAAEIADRGA